VDLADDDAMPGEEGSELVAWLVEQHEHVRQLLCFCCGAPTSERLYPDAGAGFSQEADGLEDGRCALVFSEGTGNQDIVCILREWGRPEVFDVDRVRKEFDILSYTKERLAEVGGGVVNVAGASNSQPDDRSPDAAIDVPDIVAVAVEDVRDSGDEAHDTQVAVVNVNGIVAAHPQLPREPEPIEDSKR